MKDWFGKFSYKCSSWLGSPVAFILSLMVVSGWIAAGPFFNWSEGHQLFINTFTTVITYLMVFVIQNSQNRSDLAMHMKIDELIRSIDKANNKMINAENLDEEELEKVSKELKSKTK